MRRPISICAYLYCKKEFFPKPGWEEIQKYCSTNHRKLAWKHNNRKKVNTEQKKRYKNLHPNKRVSRICLSCIKRFIAIKGHPQQKYCSIKCARKIYYPPNKKKLERKKWRKKYLKQIKERDALYKAKIRFGTTSKTLNKSLVIKRDNGICKLCSKPFQIIHHVKYSGKLKDLVLLCRACHASIHQRVKNEPFWIGEYNFED